MKLKIGFAAALLAVLALAGVAFADNSTSSTSTPAKNQVNTACVQTAVAKREAAVGSAFDAFSVTLKTALSNRGTALAAAWGKTSKSDIRSGVRSAWKAFGDAQKGARKTYKQAVAAAWKQFNAERKTCGKGAGDDEMMGQGIDAQF